jgi:single-strand DNA-binding protein
MEKLKGNQLTGNQMAYNRIILQGNLTRDVELKYLPSGTALAELGMAINEKVKKGDQYVDEPCFVDATCFGRTAEIANEYLSKGSSLLIEGRLRYSTWDKDGQRRSKHTVTVDKLQLLGGKPTGERQPQAQPAGVTTNDDPFGGEIDF